MKSPPVDSAFSPSALTQVQQELANRPWDPQADAFSQILESLKNRQEALQLHLDTQHAALHQTLEARLERLGEDLTLLAASQASSTAQASEAQQVDDLFDSVSCDLKKDSFVLLLNAMRQQESALQRHIEAQHKSLRQALEAQLLQLGSSWVASKSFRQGGPKSPALVSSNTVSFSNGHDVHLEDDDYQSSFAQKSKVLGNQAAALKKTGSKMFAHGKHGEAHHHHHPAHSHVSPQPPEAPPPTLQPSGVQSETNIVYAEKKENPIDVTCELDREEEPPRSCSDRLRDLVQGPYFDVGSGTLVVLSTILMYVSLERAGYENAVKLKIHHDSGMWDGSDAIFRIIEHVFNALFIVELVLRAFVERCQLFKDPSNLFDIAIVVSSSVDAYLLPALQTQGANMNFARLARLLRVMRVMRAFRAAALFSELRVLIRTLLNSVMALIWSVVLLGLFILASGILMAQLLESFIADNLNNMDDRLWMYQHYGTASRAVYTMFEATLSGGWPNYARPVIEKASFLYGFLWTVYVVTVVFAVIRVITALFLRATLTAASHDEEMMVISKMKEREKLVDKLKHFFAEADTSGDGMLSKDEFESILEDPKMQAWLQVLELEVYEVTALYNLLDDGTGQICSEEFIGGAMRLKGNARAIDSITIMHEQHKIKKSVQHVSEGLRCLWEQLDLDLGSNPWGPSGAAKPSANGSTLAGGKESQGQDEIALMASAVG